MCSVTNLRKFEHSKQQGHSVEPKLKIIAEGSLRRRPDMEYSTRSHRGTDGCRHSANWFVFIALGLVACASPPPLKDPFLEPLPTGVAQARDVVLAVQQSVADVSALGSDLGYEERRAVLMGVGRKYFDLPRMGELSYGPGYGELSAEQRKLWIDTFILFRSSASAKVNSRDRRQVYRLTGYRAISDGIVLIRTSVKYPHHAMEISVDYRLMRSGGQWKIVDRYSPSSVSEIAMRRSEYRTVLEKEGFDGLILDMDRRIKGYMSD